MKTASAKKSGKLASSILTVRAKKLLDREISFIDHAGFRRLSPEHASHFAGSLWQEGTVSGEELKSGFFPAVRLPYRALLTPEGETHLFRMLNFFKYRANRLRSRLNPEAPDPLLIQQIDECLSQAESARTLIIEGNLRLVVSIARRLKTEIVDVDELISEGNFVLLSAVEKFDFSRGFRFSTYATHAVQRHLFRVIRRAQRRQTFEMRAEQDLLSAAESPNPQEEKAEPSRQECQRILLEINAACDERERYILRRRFGLESENESTLRDIARDLHLSKERVRQLQQRALERIRSKVGVAEVCCQS